jgi:hypothetical protein
MKKWFLIVALFFAWIQISTAQSISYNSHAKPIFSKYGCLDCHGGSGGGLELGTYSLIFTTGTHTPVVVPGDTNSVLVKKLKGTAGFGGRMPQGGAPIDAVDLNTIIAWIKTGAIEISTTNVNDVDAGVIKTFELKQNYPNPFNPSTTIQFSIPISGNVQLTLFDALGKQSITLINQLMTAGSYQYQLNSSTMASGVYYYRLQSANTVLVKKLLLIK